MKNTKRHIALLLAAGAAALTTAAVLAAPGPGDCPMADGMPPMRGQMRPIDPARMQQMATKRFDALHDTLKLSAAQEPAWKAYRDGILADMEAMAKSRPDFNALRDKPAPDRMAAMLEHSKLRQAQMEKHLAETRKFYDQLTPEQKKTFDAHSMMGPHGGRGGMRGPRGAAPAPAPKDVQP
ncbi:Spy/CpxP family protein refolding chaperone [Niveibacterium sp.]|uniref:Spy/CpxP family protein refolding chaperone n=1 Tax=Niveibacterium sp. TaxID=2017444 RepID=UPI0035B430BA